MNQQKYIIYAVLIILLGAGMCFTIQKIEETKTSENFSLQVIDYAKPVDSLSETLSAGKMLFLSKCASCHNLFKDATGPSLIGFEGRGSWADRRNVYEWIRNPSAFMKKDAYVKSLKEKYGSMMTAFPDLTNDEIDAICDYINQAKQIRYGISLAER